MVNSTTSLTKSGLKDWFIQRVSAVILIIYTLFLLGFVIKHTPLHYVDWSMLFAHTWMKVFTLMAVLSLIGHAWVGIWTILTDYVKCSFICAVLMVIFVLAFLTYVIWCVAIFWG